MLQCHRRELVNKYDLINAKRTSSEALRPILLKMLLKALQEPALFLTKEHLNLTELSIGRHLDT